MVFIGTGGLIEFSRQVTTAWSGKKHPIEGIPCTTESVSRVIIKSNVWPR